MDEGGGVVLVAEDEQHARESLTRLLESRGYRVDAVETFPEAVAAVTDGHRYEVVILDLRLGGVKSFDLIAELASRAVPLGPTVVTGSPDPGDRAQCIARGAQRVFEKPYEPRDLLVAVKGQIERIRHNRAVLAKDLGAVEGVELSPGRAGWLDGVHAASTGWGLTPREEQTLVAMLEGLTASQAALRLGVSDETVKTFLERIRKRCGCGVRELRRRFGPPPE